MAQLIGTAEAAKRLGVSQRRVLQFIGDGRLPAQRIGNTYAIDVADLAKVADRPAGRPSKASKPRPRKSKKKP